MNHLTVFYIIISLLSVILIMLFIKIAYERCKIKKLKKLYHKIYNEDPFV